VNPAGFKVDVSRGQRVSRVSSEWFSRPDDERYLSLSELYGAVRSRADRASARTVESRLVRVEASRDDDARMWHIHIIIRYPPLENGAAFPRTIKPFMIGSMNQKC